MEWGYLTINLTVNAVDKCHDVIHQFCCPERCSSRPFVHFWQPPDYLLSKRRGYKYGRENMIFLVNNIIVFLYYSNISPLMNRVEMKLSCPCTVKLNPTAEAGIALIWRRLRVSIHMSVTINLCSEKKGNSHNTGTNKSLYNSLHHSKSKECLI